MSLSRTKPKAVAALIVATSLALAGCGFRPLYGERSATSVSAAELAAIQIETIPNRDGQMLRNNLLDKLQPRGPAPKSLYRLAVGLQTTKEGYGIREDDTATRASLTMVANYNLLDLSNGQVLLNASSRSTSSYNILDNEFATVISEDDAVRRTVQDLSEEIRTRLAVFLMSRKTAAQTGG